MTRPDLMELLGRRVTITSPTASNSWTGRLIALGDEPCAVIAQDHGLRLCLPQSYTVTRAEELQSGTGPDSGYLVGARVHGQPDDLVAKLDGMLANLQQHIDQRAQELAQPLIAKAREAAVTDVERAQHEQQRAEDLATELRRQLAVRKRYNQSYQGRASAVRALHPPVTHENRTWCKSCSENDYPMYEVPYPCPTIRALDGVAAQQQGDNRG